MTQSNQCPHQSEPTRRAVLATSAALSLVAAGGQAAADAVGIAAPHMDTPSLFLLEDLEDASKRGKLAEGDLTALRAVADWINAFVARPNAKIGRPGPVCPFVPRALQSRTLWLAPERIAGRNPQEVARFLNGYKKLFKDASPVDGDGAQYKSMVVVFTDLPADRAKDFFDDVLQRLAVPSYVEDGLVMGGFHKNNAGTAVYNHSFRPFVSPVPFLLMRNAVVSDWKFFLDDKDWLKRWARRYGEAAAQPLAEELRRLPWRANPMAPPV